MRRRIQRAWHALDAGWALEGAICHEGPNRSGLPARRSGADIRTANTPRRTCASMHAGQRMSVVVQVAARNATTKRKALEATTQGLEYEYCNACKADFIPDKEAKEAAEIGLARSVMAIPWRKLRLRGWICKNSLPWLRGHSE